MIYHGLVLAGIYLVVSGIGGLAYIPNELYSYDSELKEFVVPGNWIWFAAAGAVAHVVLGVLPGALLIRLAHPISKKCQNEVPVESYGFSDSGLYVALLLVLSVFLLVSGLGQVIVGLAQIVPELLDYDEFSMLRFGIGPLGAGLVNIISAVLIYYHSLGVVRPAA